MSQSPIDLRQQDYCSVQKILAGNKSLWDTLYNNAYGIVLRCAVNADYNHLLCFSDYRDATDEAFALCLQQLARYQGLSRFAYWVGGYARNLIRTRRTRELTRIRKQDHLLQTVVNDMWGCDPLIILIQAERNQCLQNAFFDLDSIEQKILWNQIVLKISTRKVAQELKISSKDVANLRKAALSRLKDLFVYHYYCLPPTLTASYKSGRSGCPGL